MRAAARPTPSTLERKARQGPWALRLSPGRPSVLHGRLQDRTPALLSTSRRAYAGQTGKKPADVAAPGQAAKDKTTPKGWLPRHRAHLVSGDSGSSTQWLRRQLTDPYVRQARQENLASRAAFKLQQIDDKHRILKKGSCVLDLGCSPGGWTQVAASRVLNKNQASGRKGLVIGADLKPTEINVEGAVFLQLDISSPDALQMLTKTMQEHGYDKADVVVSDMAPPATGNKTVDHLRLLELCDQALALAQSVLSPGGAFVAKVSRGGEEKEFKDKLASLFKEVVSVKPDASRSDSAEIYFLGKGFNRSKS